MALDYGWYMRLVYCPDRLKCSLSNSNISKYFIRKPMHILVCRCTDLPYGDVAQIVRVIHGKDVGHFP